MKLILDTHAVLWWLLDDPRLPQAVEDVIADPANEVYVSAVSAMELATKFRIGKLPQAAKVAGRLAEITVEFSFLPLNITAPHGDLAGGLQHKHKDPFDRLLIAQSIIEQAWLVSNETLFDDFGVRRLW